MKTFKTHKIKIGKYNQKYSYLNQNHDRHLRIHIQTHMLKLNSKFYRVLNIFIGTKLKTKITKPKPKSYS